MRSIATYTFASIVVMMVEYILILVTEGLQNSFAFADTFIFLLYMSLPLTGLIFLYLMYKESFGNDYDF